MDWLEHFNAAVTYIEEHITEEIDYEKLAKTAGFPAYHFQKMFACMAGIPLSEYIRRRRLSLAAAELQTDGSKVIDIAMRYGYSSPTAFNRAFQNVHGIPPSAAKKGGVSVNAYPPLHFSFSVKGGEKLNYRIEKKESFRIMGITCPLKKKLEENFLIIPNMWDNALLDGTLEKLLSLSNQEPYGLLGISVHHLEDWRYFIAVSSSADDSTLESLQIPAAAWAVFTGKGTNKTLQDLERRVITEWLPSSGYNYANIPDMEVYKKADPKDCRYEYWLPVVKMP